MFYNEYITTTSENPHKYYWKQINQSLDAMTKKEATKTKYIEHFNKLLQNEANKLGVRIDDNKMLAQLCYKACQSVLLEMVLTFGKPPYVAYALEYFMYAPTIFDLRENEKTVNLDLGAYYNRIVTRLETTLTKEQNANMLNKANTVVDLNKLRSDLKQLVYAFYENHPELKQSTNHIPELQGKITKLFSNLSLEFDEKSKLNNTKFNNLF